MQLEARSLLWVISRPGVSPSFAAHSAAVAAAATTGALPAASSPCAPPCSQMVGLLCTSLERTVAHTTGTNHDLQSSQLQPPAAHNISRLPQQQTSCLRLPAQAASTFSSTTASWAVRGLSSSTSRLVQPSGRFFDTVTVIPADQQQATTTESKTSHPSSGYQLLLRKYPIKTPGKNLLVLPTYSLALAVAAEWEWLPKGKPVPHLMPLTSLAATAIDQPREKQKVLEHMLKYIHTDCACIRYEPGPLQRRQAKVFDPLLRWAHQKLGWQLHSSDSIAGTTQPAATVAAAKQYLRGLDHWQLAAAEQLTTASKSLVIAVAVLHGRITAAEAVAAARIEEDYQLEDWGMVEAGHDLDIADMKARIGAPAVFHKLLRQP